MTSLINKAELEKILTTLRERLAAYEACRTDDVILAWKQHGLGVRFNDPLQQMPVVCDVLEASAICGREQYRRITNGKGEPALLTRRQEAIATYLPVLRQSVAHFEAVVAA